MPRARHIAVGLLLSLPIAGGCGTLTTSRPACRWGAAGAGFVAGGLIGGFAVNSIDLSSTQQGAARSAACSAGARWARSSEP
jgi:hypothetical protein